MGKRKTTDRKKRGRVRKGRANGHGTLERLPSGVYRARWVANGKVFTKSTGVRDRRDAETILEEFTAPYRLGSEQRTLEAVAARLEGVSAEIREWEDSQPALTVANAWDAYEASPTRPNTGAATMAHYSAHFATFERWLEANHPEIREMRQIGRAEAEAFAVALRERWSAGTYNKHIVFFRHMWRTLIDDDEAKDPMEKDPRKLPAKIQANPWDKVKKREGTAHTRRELTVEELGKVLADLTGEMRLLFAIGIYTGLRLGDCATLEWGAVDLARGRISIIPRKTARHSHGKPTVIPLHATLAALLQEIPQGRREGFVLPETAATYRRDDSALTKRIQKHFASCGIKTISRSADGRARVDVGFHSLRHTFVSLSANAGAPLAIVQAIVGHTSPAMTRHYFHESENALKSAVASLPDVTATATEYAQVAAESPRDAVERRDGADEAIIPTDASNALRAFCEAFGRLTDAERETAYFWIDSTRCAAEA